LFEAGKLDGADGLSMIRKIVLPLMVPSFMIMTVLTFIQSFEAFELVYAMQGSQGEPYHSTDTLAIYFYRLAFGGSAG
ncbi:ABC transporter permease subunit, partial [Pantoea sp. SIMBA_133]